MIPPDLKDRVAALERAAPHVHPAFQHLFALLPTPGAEFSMAQRREFLRAAWGIAAMIYGDAGPIEIALTENPSKEPNHG